MLKIQSRYLYLASTLAIIACYIFVDRSVVFFIDQNGISSFTRLRWLESIPKLFVFALPFCMLWGVFKAMTKNANYLDHALLTSSLALILTIVATYLLKYAFARHWPDTFVLNNLSLLQNGAYGFRWFEWDRGLQAFPSGHTAAIFSVATSMRLNYRALRGLGAALCLCVVVGLIGLNYHFTSDIIAGAMLGTIVSNIVFRLYTEPLGELDD